MALAALVAAALAVWLGVRAIIAPNKRGATVEQMTIDSRAVGQQLPVTVVLPAGDHGDRRPLLVFLHGRGGNQDSELDDQMFAALKHLGDRAPIVAFPYGGDHSYWHDRAEGDWGRYVVSEVIPDVARRFNADPRRVAIGGISMGGYGAFDLARADPGRFCAVGGHSPALWQTADETAPGAFDNADDFARNDVVGAARDDAAAFTDEPIWLDAGTEDPFRSGDEAFVDALRADGADLTAKLSWPGGHEAQYWNDHWSSYLRFYARALNSCGH
jgi:S-formylglutathione hydrolase FrmB